MFMLLGMSRVSAQTNPVFVLENFETWDSSQGYLNPANWYSLNTLTMFGMPPTLERTTDAHGGNFAVLLESKSSSFGDLSGVLTTGPLITPSGEPDFNKIKVPYTGKPEKIKFFYKADPEPGDSGAVVFVLTRWNSALQKPDTIGMAMAAFGDSIATYQLAELTVTYYLPFTPDSAFFIASSSFDGFNPTVGSRLWIDDMSLVGGTSGLSDATQGMGKSFEIYPNPATTHLTLETDENDIMAWEISDITGRIVWYQETSNRIVEVNISDWMDGLYLVKAIDKSAGVTVKKLILN